MPTIKCRRSNADDQMPTIKCRQSNVGENSPIRKENAMPTITPAPAEPAQAGETIEFIKKGQLTIPKRIREAYGIEPGRKGMLIDLDGALLILPQPSQIPALFDEMRACLGTSEMSLEEMVEEMRKIRESSDYDAPTEPQA